MTEFVTAAAAIIASGIGMFAAGALLQFATREA